MQKHFLEHLDVRWRTFETRKKYKDRCWFVDGKVALIRMQVKWETVFLISFLNDVIESAKRKKKITLHVILS